MFPQNLGFLLQCCSVLLWGCILRRETLCRFLFFSFKLNIVFFTPGSVLKALYSVFHLTLKIPLWDIIIIFIERLGSSSSERLSNLPKVTQSENGGAGMRTQDLQTHPLGWSVLHVYHMSPAKVTCSYWDICLFIFMGLLSLWLIGYRSSPQYHSSWPCQEPTII